MIDGPRALTIIQPWAALIVAGVKDVENRVWETSYRGRVYIHTSKRESEEIPADLTARWQGSARASTVSRLMAVRGAVIGHAELVDCRLDDPSPWAERGRFHLVLRDAVAYSAPIRVRGALGLWRTTLDLEARLRDADIVRV